MSHGYIVDKVARYYAARLSEHGATARGVDWNSAESHEIRHRQFLHLIDDTKSSVLDLGCGFGDFVRFLRQSGHHGPFIGYDVAPSMIAEAKRIQHGCADTVWRVGARPSDTVDYAVASGIFNVKGDVPLDEWRCYVDETIEVLAQSGRRGFGFNVLSLSSDPDRRRPDLYYADPVEMLKYCMERFGRSVALLQHYGLFEFTVIVRHA
ncbi:class I SAM-dependent methyltransferase [Microvirga roseola]|uniref:class I SAM-dependent methyltransferase n=1 Tax=Microvirga roseola TaxID=2883126 RepID=UPI001E3A3DD3|nr:class I SAM-dependent methyltransferase [Microvirga roseola]